MRRPAVGVTIDVRERRAGFFRLRHDYVRAVEKAGGLPAGPGPGHARTTPPSSSTAWTACS